VVHDKGGRTIILFDFAGSVVATPAASFMLPRILQPWFPRVVPQLSNAKDLNLTTSVNLHWYSQVIQGREQFTPAHWIHCLYFQSQMAHFTTHALFRKSDFSKKRVRGKNVTHVTVVENIRYGFSNRIPPGPAQAAAGKSQRH
jgi:hypothetical protein